MNEQVTRPVAESSELEQYFDEELARGHLVFQRSSANAWLPPRAEDPVSLSDDWEWVHATGEATLVSWVRYHISYHPYFADKLPYLVGVVELAEGPRMIAPLDVVGHDPAVGMKLTVDIRFDGGSWIPLFRAAE